MHCTLTPNFKVGYPPLETLLAWDGVIIMLIVVAFGYVKPTNLLLSVII